ncbi:MAG: hypothetical protein R2737_14845 [Candidatus Nanopelagicales bacterium]
MNRSRALVAGSLVVFLACGTLLVLAAARLLSASDYTVFAAFSAVFGFAVLGPAGALEQRAAVLARPGTSGTDAARHMARPAALTTLAVVALALIPVGGWQQALFGEQDTLASVLLAVGTPVVGATAVLRGVALGQGRNVAPAASNVGTGLASLALTAALVGVGASRLEAFLVGPVAAWMLALVIMGVAEARESRRGSGRQSLAVDARGHLTASAWTVTANLLMLANLLIVPALLRLQVDVVGPDAVAATQLLVSMSRLVSSVMLGLVPVEIAHLASRQPGPSQRRVARGWVAAALAVSAAAVLVLTLTGGPLAAFISGKPVDVGPGLAFLAVAPVLALTPTLAAVPAGLIAGRERRIASGWALGLAVLLGAAGLLAASGLEPLLLAVLLSATLPALTIIPLTGSLGRRKTRVPFRNEDASAESPG